MKRHMSLSNLGTVAFHAVKVPTNVFSSTLICLLTIDYKDICYSILPMLKFIPNTLHTVSYAWTTYL